MVGVLLYFGWALAFWRQQPGDETDAAPIHGNTRIQATWIVATSAIVLALAVYGTIELWYPAGAGAGEGPQPIWKPAGTTTSSLTSWTPGGSNILQVQVIGQQWAWTYRYPQFGGFETTQLMLPVGQPVQFNVTSLDVIHSFWAYTLGVKADANPGLNNVAYTTPQHTGYFQVRCAELCGIWHGSMYDTGDVVSVPAFLTVDADDQGESRRPDQDTAAVRAHLRPDQHPGGQDQHRARPDQRGRRLLQPGGPGTAVGKERATSWLSKPSRRAPRRPAAATRVPRRRNGTSGCSPGIHTAVIGAIVGYIFGHWLGNFIGSQYQQVGSSDDNDFAIVLGFSFLVIGWLIGLGVFDDLVRQMLGRPIRSARPQSQRRRHGQVLQVHPRPQGRRPAVPGRHADLLLHRRPAGDRDQDRAALADAITS